MFSIFIKTLFLSCSSNFDNQRSSLENIEQENFILTSVFCQENYQENPLPSYQEIYPVNPPSYNELFGEEHRTSSNDQSTPDKEFYMAISEQSTMSREHHININETTLSTEENTQQVPSDTSATNITVRLDETTRYPSSTERFSCCSILAKGFLGLIVLFIFIILHLIILGLRLF